MNQVETFVAIRELLFKCFWFGFFYLWKKVFLVGVFWQKKRLYWEIRTWRGLLPLAGPMSPLSKRS